MTTPTIERCMFCGSENTCINEDPRSGLFHVRCRDCFGQGPPSFKKAQVAKQWNAASQAVQAAQAREASK